MFCLSVIVNFVHYSTNALCIMIMMNVLWVSPFIANVDNCEDD